jgi:dipeptidyl aminopeptidase/acylaminoacyl peptidase
MRLRTFAAMTAMGLALASPALAGIVPPNSIQADGVPALADQLKVEIGKYTEFRGNAFAGFDPRSDGILITTRAGEVTHLHRVDAALGAARQLTQGREPVTGGSYAPVTGDVVVFSQDVGGGEFFQLFRLDPKTGETKLLTDGKSRNSGAVWRRDGKQIVYSSTRRNGKDSDLYVMDPRDPSTDRLLLQVDGAGERWAASGWSPDGKKILLLEYVSANESYVWLLDVASGQKTALTPRGKEPVSNSSAQYEPSGKAVWFTSDEGSEAHRLVRLDLASGKREIVTPGSQWDVERFSMPDTGGVLAYLVNEAGLAKLHLLDLKTRKEVKAPALPAGLVNSATLNRAGTKLAVSMIGAQTPGDVYLVDLKTQAATRWTQADTGGAPLDQLREPELVSVKSFDGLTVSGFYYRPDPARFPGKRPVIVSIHGGPEGQSRPTFLGRYNYLLAELGIGVFYPNVRGSTGYGKTFLALDNGMKREDSVKDIGSFLDWLKSDAATDGDRIGVTGGSYGGYMTLATMTHYSDRLRAGLDVVGISNFVTFLTNTQDYRRDLRRVEYGDERDPAMRTFLEKISPLTNVAKITKPMLIVQGQNDPRVPYTEAEQMVKALRAQNVPTWYIVGKDEGHGFRKKTNSDFQFFASVQFWKQYLLGTTAG